MRLGLIVLIVGYGLSQFYRAFLAVFSGVLSSDIGVTPESLSTALGTWFVIFALMQIPVGEALDRIGPRITTSVLLGVAAGGGAIVFSFASAPWHVNLAMALIGIGCSPVLMASYFIFARVFPPAMFATLAGATLGFGSLGNIASSAPTAWAVEVIGWRETMLIVGVLTFVVAIVLFFTIKDPEKVETAHRGSLLDLLKMPVLWPIFVMVAVNYIPAAGIRGLWSGPYAASVLGADTATIGNITLVMGLAMIAGNFAYGPMDRLFGTRKWVIWGGNLIGMFGLIGLALFPASGIVAATVMLAIVGFFGASFPMIVAHARGFFPAHLTGRGVTLVNLFSIGSVGLSQFATRPLFESFQASTSSPAEAYSLLFWCFAGLIGFGLVIYLFAKDRTD